MISLNLISFSYSYFFNAITYALQMIITSSIITLIIKYKAKKINQKIDLTQTFFWSLIFGLPISIVFTYYEIYGNFVILILNILGGFVGFQFQYKRNDFYKIFIISKRIKILTMSILFLTFLAGFLIEKRYISSFDLDTENKDITELKEKFTIESINTYFNYEDKSERLDVVLLDSSKFENIVFHCDFLINDNEIKGIQYFLANYKKIINKIQSIIFLREFVENSQSRYLKINYFDSSIHRESIIQLLESQNDLFTRINEINSEIEILKYFGSNNDKIDSLNNKIISLDEYHIYKQVDSLISIDLVNDYSISSWLYYSSDSIFLIKSRNDIFLYKNFHHTFGLIKPKKLIVFNKNGELIDSTFANSK